MTHKNKVYTNTLLNKSLFLDVNNIKVVSVNFTNRRAHPRLQVMNINNKVITMQNSFTQSILTTWL